MSLKGHKYRYPRIKYTFANLHLNNARRRSGYDMMVARFAGGGGNLSAANCFFSLR